MEVKGLFYLVMHLLVSEYQRIDVTEAQLRDNKNLNRLSTITSYIKENYASEMTLESSGEDFWIFSDLSFKDVSEILRG